jgi:hypothetical protein
VEVVLLDMPCADIAMRMRGTGSHVAASTPGHGVDDGRSLTPVDWAARASDLQLLSART